MFKTIIRRWREWRHPATVTLASGDILTIPGHYLHEGQRIEICTPSGIPKDTPLIVTNVTGSVLSFRELRWYERLRERLKFEPVRNYRHRNGTLDICQTYSTGAYYDLVCVVPNTRIGRLVQRFYNFLHRHQEWICKYDFESLDIREGEYFPMWSGSYWWFQPFRFANRFFPRIDGAERRIWPEVIGE